MKINEVFKSDDIITPPLSVYSDADKKKIFYDEIGHGVDNALKCSEFCGGKYL